MVESIKSLQKKHASKDRPKLSIQLKVRRVDFISLFLEETWQSKWIVFLDYNLLYHGSTVFSAELVVKNHLRNLILWMKLQVGL